MKKAAIVAGVLGALFYVQSFALAAETIGFYAGAKVGGSVVNMRDRQFGMRSGGVVYEGVDFAWGNESRGISSESDTVFGGGLLAGYDFSRRCGIPVRAELDYTLRDRASKTGSGNPTWNYTANGVPVSETEVLNLKTSIRLQTLMANLWVDIPTGTAFKPYLGGGIGWAFIGYRAAADEGSDEEEAVTSNAHKTNFAWSLGGGLGYDITDNWAVDLGYRYINAGSVRKNFTDTGIIVYSKIKRVESHDIMVSLRYTF